MKKYLAFLLMCVLLFSLSCTTPEKDPFVPDKIVANHNISFLEQKSSSYIILKGKKSDDNYLTSITFYNTIIKDNITNRMHEYYQVDYLNNSDKYDCYFHEFDSIDGVTRVFAQNFFPYVNYDNSSIITSISVLVRFSYLNSTFDSIVDTITYKEDMITFNSENYLDIEDSSLSYITKTDNLDEDIYRYKLYFGFDSSQYQNGHFDVQTWLEYDTGDILPFYGLYHYQVDNGSHASVSDETIAKNLNPKFIYWEIRHYDNNGNLTSQYLKQRIE